MQWISKYRKVSVNYRSPLMRNGLKNISALTSAGGDTAGRTSSYVTPTEWPASPLTTHWLSTLSLMQAHDQNDSSSHMDSQTERVGSFHTNRSTVISATSFKCLRANWAWLCTCRPFSNPLRNNNINSSETIISQIIKVHFLCVGVSSTFSLWLMFLLCLSCSSNGRAWR